MCCIAWISSTSAMCVCPGIITGLHVQSADFAVHGSDQSYILKRVFSNLLHLRALAICQRVVQTPARRSAAPVQLQLWVPFGRCSLLAWSTASLLSVVVYTPNRLFQHSILLQFEICGVGLFHNLHQIMFPLLNLV